MSFLFMNIRIVMSMDLQVKHLCIDTEACKLFYSIFGDGTNNVTIKELAYKRFKVLPTEVLQLRLTVSQSAGSGLTTLSITGQAMRIFRNFTWSCIYAIYPDRWSNFVVTLTAAWDNRIWVWLLIPSTRKYPLLLKNCLFKLMEK